MRAVCRNGYSGATCTEKCAPEYGPLTVPPVPGAKINCDACATGWGCRAASPPACIARAILDKQHNRLCLTTHSLAWRLC
jgi:hypothetical protein